jgi:hypothetical protein
LFERAPPAGSTVALKVDDIAAGNTTTDGAGNFTAVVALRNVTHLSKVVLTNPGRSLVECGNAPGCESPARDTCSR